MDKTQEMLVEIEELIITEAKRLKSKKMGASPEEMKALAELVHAINLVPRTIETFSLNSAISELKNTVATL